METGKRWWVVGGWGSRARVGGLYPRVGHLFLAILLLLAVGCEAPGEEARAEAELANARAAEKQAEGDADAARIRAEGDAEAAVLAAEASAIEAEANANEAKAAVTEASALLEQAEGDRSLKEALAAQVNGVTEMIESTSKATGRLATLMSWMMGVFGFLGFGFLALMAYQTWRGRDRGGGGQIVVVRDYRDLPPEWRRAIEDRGYQRADLVPTDKQRMVRR